MESAKVEDARAAAQRRGPGRLFHRLKQPDCYSAALVIIILSVISVSAVGATLLGDLFVLAILSTNVVFALYTSRASRKLVQLSLLLVTIALALAALSSAAGPHSAARSLGASLGVALTIVTSWAISKRLAQHPSVNLQTIMGALCVYLLIGMSFAYLYRLLDDLGMDPFFAQMQAPRAVDYTYFSLVTLTTVGYGDLTVTHEVARMLAVTEALLGQFYLVTVVALLVSRVAPHRRQDEQ